MCAVVIDYRLDRFVDKLGREALVYVPIIDLVLHANHKYSPGLACYLDTGAHYNVFPEEVALASFGMSQKSISKGLELPILGVGGCSATAYGFDVEIIHPYFKFMSKIYFLKNQPFPLLGRVGFMDHFDKITLNEKDKKLELVI
ncbi:MAG: hypothetical protein UW82_C0027G0003 [candidate division WWE3 bacterium GW2011_GWC2_44_9]|uniref:Peptidase A2 domain-containing protein n=1 Tax=candidate division WWE3 bacterium GW2011_GWC2_44_9 TaxID=1619125 RepID=A0A0G1KK84_UNCKA|nr:MAG: hypothetical protein UW82_C0027G0003 [candidate division WWE3 bacterium GW2011_GWC2_44_9]